MDLHTLKLLEEARSLLNGGAGSPIITVDKHMPVHSIPETRPSGDLCPSLYTIIQFTCSLAACCVLTMCFSSTLWVETFIYTEKEQFRLISVGLWRVCYYQDISHPSTATECINVKYKDFTLSVQICQCFAVIMSCLSLILYVIRMVSSCVKDCCGCDPDRIHYETRKFRIVCYLIAILAMVISLPLYICEAHIEGVQLNPIVKREKATVQSDTVTTAVTTAMSVNETSLINSTLTDGGTTTATSSVFDGDIELPHYSVFAWAIWMEFAALGLTSVAFSMALIKHASKRKEKYSRPPNIRSPRSLPNLPLDFIRGRPRSESQRAFVRQGSVISIPDTPMSP